MKKCAACVLFVLVAKVPALAETTLELSNETEGCLYYELTLQGETARLGLLAEGGENRIAVGAGEAREISAEATIWTVSVAGGLAEMNHQASDGDEARIVCRPAEVQGVPLVEVALEKGGIVEARHLVYMAPIPDENGEGGGDEEKEPTVDELLARKARLESDVLRKELEAEIRGLESRLVWLEHEANLYYPPPGTYGYYGHSPTYSFYSGYGYPGFSVGYHYGLPLSRPNYRYYPWPGGTWYRVGVGWNNGYFYHGTGGTGLYWRCGDFRLRAGTFHRFP